MSASLLLAAGLALALPERAVDAQCRPALPYFCANIHVGCAGQSELATFPFRLRAGAEHGAIESTHGFALPGHYRNARVEWEPQEASVILRPQDGPGYIKLEAGGKYSFRHYLKGGAVMSYGHCD